MRKAAFTFLLTAFYSLAAHAQTAYDAWLFSENNYEGTARTVAMGNAFTALGGDLGAVSINPAGSAVAGYSQIAFTPALTISSTVSQGVPYQGSTAPYFQRKMKSNITKAGIPNAGMTFCFETGRNTGLKSTTIGFIINRTNSWCEDLYANGTNSTTCFSGAAAYDATETIKEYNRNRPASEPEYTFRDFVTENAYDYMPWKDVLGYQSGMFTETETDDKTFIGASQPYIGGNVLQEPVNQTYGRSISGNKFEYIFNIGANISDFVYIGMNIGFVSLAYDYTQYFKESSIEPELFENTFVDAAGNTYTTYFRDLMHRYNYSATGTGIYGKFGIIITPGAGLRIGAAISTPTSNTIQEQWRENGRTSFTDTKFDASAESPRGTYEYDFNSPFRANFGIAYTIGKYAVVSADYELADYSKMKFKSNEDEDREYFEDINYEIGETYGTAHYLRIGAEVKPTPELAIRAGYNLSTSAQKWAYDQDGTFFRLDPVYGHNISFGAGYSSKGSFFADVACRHTFATDEYIYPYTDYRADEGILSPEILSRHSNWKVLLTLGWRF